MRVRQPPDSLVQVDVLQTHHNKAKYEEHGFKGDVCVARYVWDVGMLW